MTIEELVTVRGEPTDLIGVVERANFILRTDESIPKEALKVSPFAQIKLENNLLRKRTFEENTDLASMAIGLAGPMMVPSNSYVLTASILFLLYGGTRTVLRGLKNTMLTKETGIPMFHYPQADLTTRQNYFYVWTGERHYKPK